MSYCVNCGVELAPSEKKCPLCGTPVINPNVQEKKEAEGPFPRLIPEEPKNINWGSIWLLITLIFMVPIGLALTCDINISHEITWSKFVVASLGLIYFFIITPLFTMKSNMKMRSVLCVILDTVWMELFLFAIERSVGGSWFMKFAFPLAASMGMAIIFCQVICIYAPMWKLSKLAVIVAVIGVMCVVIEALLNYGFGFGTRLVWSFYPLITLIVLGGILMVIDHNPEMKEKIKRRFFL